MATTLVRIQLLSKTSTDFATANPVLLDGEFGVANAGSSAPVLKVGDGVRPWSALPDVVAAGAGADYVAGPVYPLPPGAPPEVIIDNGVSPPTISFGIPSGEQGATGPAGPVGPTGPTGSAGTVLADDSHVTGDWVFDKTQWFGLTPADVATIKANSSAGVWGANDSWVADTVARIVRQNANVQFVFSRVNGTYAAMTPLLASEEIARIVVKGSKATSPLGFGGSIRFITAGAWTDLSTPARMDFYLVPIDSTVETLAASFANAATTFTATTITHQGRTILNSGSVAGANTVINGATAAGPYVTLQRSGVAFGDIGNGSAMGGTFTLDALAFSARAGFAIQMAAGGATTPQLTITPAGVIECLSDVRVRGEGRFVGWWGDPGPADLIGPGIELGYGSGYGRVYSFDRTAGLFKSLYVAGSDVNVMDASSTVRLRIATDTITIYAGTTPEGLRIARDDGYISFYNTAQTTRSGFIQYGAASALISHESGYLSLSGAGITRMAIGLPSTGVRIYGTANSCYFMQGANESVYIDPGMATGSIYLGVSNGAASIEFGSQVNFGSHYPKLLGIQNADSSSTLKFGPGGGSYGTMAVQGAASGFHGLCVDDGGLRPTFISNNASAGIFVQSDGKWLIERQSTTVANCGYNLQAPSFNATSSRKIKRETGKPSRAAEILARLRPIFYRLLAKGSPEQMGMIAEEVHAVCPQLSDGKTISYDRLAVLLLADWQESRGIHSAT